MSSRDFDAIISHRMRKYIRLVNLLRQLADEIDALCDNEEPKLGMRAWVGLQQHLGDKKITPENVSKVRRCEMLRVNNIGNSTIVEIEKWLKPHGLTLRD